MIFRSYFSQQYRIQISTNESICGSGEISIRIEDIVFVATYANGARIAVRKALRNPELIFFDVSESAGEKVKKDMDEVGRLYEQ